MQDKTTFSIVLEKTNNGIDWKNNGYTIINNTNVMTFQGHLTKEFLYRKWQKKIFGKQKAIFLFTFFHSVSNYYSLRKEVIFRCVCASIIASSYVKRRLLLPNG